MCVLNTLYIVYHTSLNCLFSFGYTLSLFSRNFKPHLVMPKFEACVSVYRPAKLPPLQPAPCYPEIFNIYLCLVVLRQLPPSQPAPCYSKITMRAKTPTSCEIPTREMPMIPLNRKNLLAQISGGTFVTYPTFRTSASLSHGSPTPIPSAHPFIHRGRQNPPPSAAQPEPLP